ncbi:MAG: glycosyltransferase [Parachlamydia sp.]|nr:glycosyltransferase [Parachlamydia sp.]
MRILIIATFFPPLNSIASLRPYSWAKCWSLAGHDVTVLTMQKPPHPTTDLHLPNTGYRLVEVPPPRFLQALKKDYRETSQAARKPSLFKRGLIRFYNYLKFKRGLFHSCRMPDFADFWIRRAGKVAEELGSWDLVVSTAGPYAVHIIAEKLKKRGVAMRWIADYRDNWSDNHIYPGLFPFSWIESILEKKLMRSADAITATSAPFAAKMQSRYDCKARVQVIENGFDPDDFASLPAVSIFPNDGKFRIVYTGTIYPGKQDPSSFFQAVSELPQELDQLEILFVGHQLEHLSDLIKRFGIERYVRILGFVSREEALRMQRDAHLLLFIVWKDLAERGVYSGKIYEYLFSGTRILAIGAGGMDDSQQLIVESGTGVALHHVSDIKNFLIAQLSQGKKEAVDADQQVLARFNRQTLAHKLLQLK